MAALPSSSACFPLPSTHVVSLEGVDKVLLLQYLWGAADQLHSARAQPFNPTAAAAVIPTGVINTFCNRVLYVDLSGATASPCTYDAYYGRDAFALAVRKVRTLYTPPESVSGAGFRPLRATGAPALPARMPHAPPPLLAPMSAAAASTVQPTSGLYEDFMERGARVWYCEQKGSTGDLMNNVRSGRVTHIEFIEESNPNGAWVRCLFRRTNDKRLWNAAPFSEFQVFTPSAIPRGIPEWDVLLAHFHCKSTNTRIWLVRK